MVAAMGSADCDSTAIERAMIVTVRGQMKRLLIRRVEDLVRFQ